MSGVVRLRGVASHTSRYRIALYAVGYFSQQQSSLGHFILCLCVRVCVCVGCREHSGVIVAPANRFPFIYSVKA